MEDTDFERKVIYNNKTYTYKFDFLTPVANVSEIHYSNLNDFSPIIKFEYNNYSILFTGDAEEAVEEELLSNYQASKLDVDLLKVGHHGSDSSSTLDFINAVKPEYAVISCGKGNRYEHPHKVTLDKFMAYGVSNDFALYRTDNNGTVVATIKSILQNDDSDFTVSCERSSANNFISPKSA